MLTPLGMQGNPAEFEKASRNGGRNFIVGLDVSGERELVIGSYANTSFFPPKKILFARLPISRITSGFCLFRGTFLR